MATAAVLRNRGPAPIVGKIVTEGDLAAKECEDEEADEISACWTQRNCPWLITLTRNLAYLAATLLSATAVSNYYRWWVTFQDGRGFANECSWSPLCSAIPWPPPGFPESVEERLQAVHQLEDHMVHTCGGTVHSSIDFFSRADGSVGGRMRNGADAPAMGEPMLRLPMQCAMSDSSARISPVLGPLLGAGPGLGVLEDRLTLEGEQYLDTAGWILVLHVAIELTLGNNSRFWPYLRTLPRRPDVPLLWDEPSLRLLAGTGMDVYNLESLRPALLRLHSQFFGHGSPLAGLGPDLDTFLTAYALVRSRYYWHAGRAMMVPLLDLVNHHQHATEPWMAVYWEYRETEVCLFSPQSVVLAGNTELFYDYWHDDEVLATINLQLYGFVQDTMAPYLALDARDLSPQAVSDQWFGEVADAAASDYANLVNKSSFWLKAEVWPDGHESTISLEDSGEVLHLLCYLRLHALQASGRRPESIREQGRPACSASSADWCNHEPGLENAVLQYFSDLLQSSQQRLAKAVAEQQHAHLSNIARLEVAKRLNSMVSALHTRVSSGIQTAMTSCKD